MLADVFENFRNMCLKLCKLDLSKFVSAPGLAWQAALKKTEEKCFNLYQYLEKGIRRGICYSVWHTKANNKYMKDYDKKRIVIYSILKCQ